MLQERLTLERGANAHLREHGVYAALAEHTSGAVERQQLCALHIQFQKRYPLDTLARAERVEPHRRHSHGAIPLTRGLQSEMLGVREE